MPKPVGPGGLPLPRPDNAVTWAITADNEPIPDGVADEGGPLGIYNYADYLDPSLIKKFEKLTGRKVQVATYNSSDEAIAKLSSGAVAFDLIVGLSGSNIVNLIAQQLIQPLNHSYLPNFEKNVWPELQDPFYDRDSRYTVPYVVWSDGIGWRNDKIAADIPGMKVPWDIFWESQPYTGKVAILDDKRDALSMPMQRDAMRTGRRPDLNTEDQKIVAQAGKDSRPADRHRNVKVAITDYQTLPEAKTWLHQSWSGDLLGAAFYYMPKGVPPSVLSYWAPDVNGVVQNDFFCIGRTAKNPALAHRFVNFMLDEKIAYENMVHFVGLYAAAEEHRRGVADQERPDPEEPRRRRRPSRPVPVQPGAAPAERRGRAVLGRGLVEVQGRLSDGLALDLAAARASRGRLARGLLPARVLRRHRRRVRQPEHALRAGAVLEPARLERRLHARHAAEHLARRPVPDRLRAHVRVRRDRARAGAR